MFIIDYKTSEITNYDDKGNLIKSWKSKDLSKESMEVKFHLVCQAIAEGSTVKSICDGKGWKPSSAEFYQYMAAQTQLKKFYSMAKLARLEHACEVVRQRIMTKISDPKTDPDELARLSNTLIKLEAQTTMIEEIEKEIKVFELDEALARKPKSDRKGN